MANAAQKSAPSIEKGDNAPDFTLATDGGNSITLSELKGKNVVIFFYPKDDTPGCTVEAKQFAELNDKFEAADTVVIGISKDSVSSHDKFKNKYSLPFTLGSDESCEVCEAYGVWVEKNMYGKKYMGIQRATFLVNKEGKVEEIWPKVKPDGHAQEVLESVSE